MLKSELLEILSRLNWSQAELARRVSVSFVTVSRWETVPGPVAAYIRLYERVKGCLE